MKQKLGWVITKLDFIFCIRQKDIMCNQNHHSRLNQIVQKNTGHRHGIICTYVSLSTQWVLPLALCETITDWLCISTVSLWSDKTYIDIAETKMETSKPNVELVLWMNSVWKMNKTLPVNIKTKLVFFFHNT